jgi:hypothetical protein
LSPSVTRVMKVTALWIIGVNGSANVHWKAQTMLQ